MSRVRHSLYSLMGSFCLAIFSSAPLALAEYEVMDVSGGGTIKGQALWKGPIPKLPPLKVFADLDTCGTKVPSPVLLVDSTTQGVHRVLVYLEQVDRGKAAKEKYRMAMGKSAADPTTRSCQFQQQIFPFVRTWEFSMVNFEPILHNPHLFSHKHSSLFNIAMPTADREIETTLTRARGVGLHLQCDVHVRVNAWAAAFDHPYFALTDQQGRFENQRNPAGVLLFGGMACRLRRRQIRVLARGIRRPAHHTAIG